MSASRPQIVAVLTAVGLAAVACAYGFLNERAESTSLTKPALQVVEHANAPRTTGAIAAYAGPSARVAIEPAAPPPAPSPSPVEESKPADPRAAEKAQWVKEFAGLKREALEKARDKISHELSELAREPITTWFDAGRYEVVGHGLTYSFGEETWDHTKVNAVRLNSPGTDEIRMVVLPESQYPEFYVVKRKILWLENQMQQPERQD